MEVTEAALDKACRTRKGTEIEQVCCEYVPKEVGFVLQIGHKESGLLTSGNRVNVPAFMMILHSPC
jgi:hypothetical protein